MEKFVFVFALVLGAAVAVPLHPEENDFDERIVGGSTAPTGAYPYQVSLRQRNSHFCGGSIISNRYILCAAHCTYGQNPGNILVVVGTNRLNSGGWGYGVQQYVNHHQYNPQDNRNDISILYTSSPIAFNQLVNYIGLSNFIVPPGTRCILSGWGLTRYPSNDIPNDLQHIELQSISVAQCKQFLPGYPVYDTHVCTYNGRGQGACKGDSGGPLVCLGVQGGIVSWGIPCALGNPDIFTSVAHYLDWINQVTGL